MWHRIGEIDPRCAVSATLLVVSPRPLTTALDSCALPVESLVVDGVDGYYLLRPDGYVALRTDDESSFIAALGSATAAFRA